MKTKRSELTDCGFAEWVNNSAGDTDRQTDISYED